MENSLALLEHVTTLGLAAQECGFGVEGEGRVPIVLRTVLCCMVAIYACIVDSNVQATQLRDHRLDHSAM